jgi:hypothetical protein
MKKEKIFALLIVTLSLLFSLSVLQTDGFAPMDDPPGGELTEGYLMVKFDAGVHGPHNCCMCAPAQNQFCDVSAQCCEHWVDVDCDLTICGHNPVIIILSGLGEVAIHRLPLPLSRQSCFLVQYIYISCFQNENVKMFTMNYPRLLLISIILLTLLFSGCRDNRRDSAIENDGFISIPVDVDNAGSLLFSDIFEKPQFVPLETTMYSLVGSSISQVYLTDSLIVLAGHDSRVLIFNRDGKFISSIYNRGRGPDEYLELYYVDVDEESGHIWFFDPQGYFICMDHQGNFLERIRINNAYGYPMFKHPFTDQLLLILHPEQL